MSRDTAQKQLRLRIVAGPNGSGKSTVTKFIRKQKVNSRRIDFGFYVNADDISITLAKENIQFKKYGITTTTKEFKAFALTSGLINENFTEYEFLASFKIRLNKVSLKSIKYKEYLAQVVADFLRKKLLKERKKFSFEKWKS